MNYVFRSGAENLDSLIDLAPRRSFMFSLMVPTRRYLFIQDPQPQEQENIVDYRALIMARN